MSLVPNKPTTPRRFIIENAVWLLGSTLLAVIVWFAAVNQQNPVQQQRFRDTIRVNVLKDDTMLVVNPPLPVQVVIRAPSTVWTILQDDDITVNADLRGKPAGSYTVALTAALSSARLGAVSEVLPSQITIELAKSSEQVFNVNVSAIQSPPVGFQIANAKPSVPTTKVSGSEAQVKRVAAVEARMNLSDQSKPVTRTVDLLAVDAEGNVVPDVTLVPQQVTVTVDIQPRPGVTVLNIAPTFQESTLPQGYLLSNYSAAPVRVAVRGERTIIEALNGSIPTDPIDLTGKTQSFTQTVKLALPNGVTLTDPVDVVVTVQVEAINVTREFVNIPVQTQGLDPADFAITLQPDHVTVIVKGPQTALDAVQASDLTVIAPLAGLGGGTYTVTLQASIAHAGLTNANLSIPNVQAQVTIRALHPTSTPTITPTVPPTAIPPPGPTASPTP
jgi:YbbR domain-containing protein